jgi:hypothetical protein
VPSVLTIRSDQRQVTINPVDPLPVNATVEIWLAGSLRDRAGNPLSGAGWTVITAPGTPYDPSRSGVTTAGTHTGYEIAQSGDLRTAEQATLGRTRGASFGQRATLPNLPGRWLLVETGPLSGRWLRESSAQYLRGESERRRYTSPVSIRLRPATHIARRFDSAGAVTASRTLSVSRNSSAHADVRAIVNGRAYWHLVDGPLAGYWLAESSVAFRPGTIQRLSLPAAPRILLSAGTHSGYRYDWAGRATSTITARITSTTGMRITAWAVINGRPHFLVSTGTWAGTWLPESTSTRLRV